MIKRACTARRTDARRKEAGRTENLIVLLIRNNALEI